MKKQGAFTLLEAIITMAIFALLAAVAVPAYQTMVKNNRLTGQVNEVVTALLFARSEAVKRSEPVALCASIDLESCSGTNEWEKGWIVFIDENDNLTFESTEEILRVQNRFGTNTVRAEDTSSSTALDILAYNAEGMSSNPARFRFCDDRGTSEGKVVRVSGTGRPSQADTPPASCP